MNDLDRDTAYRADQLKMKADYQRHLLRVAGWDAGMRMVLALILVLGLFGVVAIGVVNEQAATQLSPLVAPLAGLAGLAVGYFFGQGSTPPPNFDDLDHSRWIVAGHGAEASPPSPAGPRADSDPEQK